MRRILALTLVTLAAPIVLSTTHVAAADPLPIIGDGEKKRMCVVWYGSENKSVGSPESSTDGAYCVTY